jgi:WD40 repeat protein
VLAADPAQSQPPDKPKEAVKKDKPAVPEPGCVLKDAHGDPLPAGAVARLGSARWRHGGPVGSLSLSADGKFLASGSQHDPYGRNQDRSARLWDAVSGQELYRLQKDKNNNQGSAAVAVSPDGKLVAVGQGNSVALWDTATGKEVRRAQDARGDSWMFSSLAFSPDGKQLAAGGQGRNVFVWDVASGKEVRKLPVYQGPHAVAFSPDGKMLAAGAGTTVHIWQADDGKLLHKLRQHRSRVSSVAFSPDSKQLASGALDHQVRLWDVGTGKLLHQMGHPGPKVAADYWGYHYGDYQYSGPAVAFAPDGKVLASGAGDQIIRLWDTATGKELRRCEGHFGAVTAVVFAPDGKTLYSGSADTTIGVWEAATGKRLNDGPGHSDGVLRVAFSADGRQATTVGKGGIIRVWDRHSTKELRRLGDGTESDLADVAVSADGNTLAIIRKMDETVDRWDLAAGKELPPVTGPQGGFYALSLAPDGKHLAVVDTSSSVRLWDASTGKEVRQLCALGGYSSTSSGEEMIMHLAVTFSPDGKAVAVAGARVNNNPSIRLVDTATGKDFPEQASFQNDQNIYRLLFSPDGKTLAALSSQNLVYLARVGSGKGSRQLQLDQDFGIRALAFSPDGQLLAVGDKKKLRLFELATGKEVRQLLGHHANIRSVAFSPDGLVLASAGLDTTVLFWDVAGTSEKPDKPLAIEEVEKLWVALGGEDPAKAYQAQRSLVAAGEQALPLFQNHLKPMPAVEPKQLTQLLADLDSAEFSVRQKASEELERMGEQSADGLRQALAANPSLEVRRRIEQVLERVDNRDPPPEALRALRAVRALEHIGSPEARQLLQALAKGAPQAWLTQAARDAAARLDRRK